MIDLLDLLDGVRQTGPDRWIARCPAHEDRGPSLSVRRIDGERWLVHDFAGCTAAQVCDALGLRLWELLAERPCVGCGVLFQPEHSDWDRCSQCFKTDTPRTPARRIPRMPARDAIVALDHEVLVAVVIAHDIVEHREVDERTWQRLATAAARIGEARALCYPDGVEVRR